MLYPCAQLLQGRGNLREHVGDFPDAGIDLLTVSNLFLSGFNDAVDMRTRILCALPNFLQGLARVLGPGDFFLRSFPPELNNLDSFGCRILQPFDNLGNFLG